jgi:hypothetical protein
MYGDVTVGQINVTACIHRVDVAKLDIKVLRVRDTQRRVRLLYLSHLRDVISAGSSPVSPVFPLRLRVLLSDDRHGHVKHLIRSHKLTPPGAAHAPQLLERRDGGAGIL